jgi:drug/metabolite transporter (DMT)-like permease
MEHTHRNLSGTMTLLLAALIWGFAFVAQRAGMRYVGPFTFNGLRFALGTLVLLPWLAAANRRRSPADDSSTRRQRWIMMALAGLVLFVSANLQQAGLVVTTAGKAGFITGLYVVIIPLLGMLRRHRVNATVWSGCALAAVGLYLLSVTGVFSVSAGDALVLGGAFGWAVHVHIVDWLAARVHPIRIAVLQFSICAALSLIVGGLSESIRLSAILDAGWMIAYAGVLSVGVAYTLQVIGQRRVDPARAGILLSLEAAFAVLGGWILLGESLSMRGAIGCTLMMAGMVLAQIRRRSSADAVRASSSA